MRSAVLGAERHHLEPLGEPTALAPSHPVNVKPTCGFNGEARHGWVGGG
jgi:hypothetical protein